MKTLTEQTAHFIKSELENIPEKYQKNFNSIHEGYAVILEEVRELEQEVFFGEKKAKQEIAKAQLTTGLIDCTPEELHKDRMREECVQIAAMCARFIQELT